jgi:UDP-N-acetylglucosamine/UDP-N-acetylgalactosamine diphosphorylase
VNVFDEPARTAGHVRPGSTAASGGGPRQPLPGAWPARLEAHGQGHLLRHWHVLEDSQRRAFVAQLESIDWNLVDRLRHLAAAGTTAPDTAWLSRCRSPQTQPGHDRGRAIEAGREALTAGRVGAILVAGGQGTRLGFEGPKGLFPIGPLTGRTLFGALLGGLEAIRRRYGRRVPLAIMTSTATDSATREALRAHDWFGLDPRHVLVFRQADVPPLTRDGLRMLLDAPGHIAMAPDGHGGLLRALVTAGGLDWFEDRAVDQLACFQVDNPLARPLDPEFLGRHLLEGSDIATQVVEKTDPAERVGVVVECDGRTRLVEYSDLEPEVAARRLADGRLALHCGSIAVHCFRLGFLREATTAKEDALPFHLARKVVPFVDDDGLRVVPREPNALKFERFIFDLFPLAARVLVHAVDPRESFAPLKNPPGAASDGPEQVREAILSYGRRLLARAGVRVADGVDVEIDPSRVIDEADIPPLLPPGGTLSHSTVIG